MTTPAAGDARSDDASTIRPNSIAVFVAIFVVMFLRRPDSLLNAQFWAEDGIEWFRVAFLERRIGTVWLPYNGYFNFLPRLIAYGGVLLFPVSYLPFVYNFLAAVLGSWCIWLFSHRCCRVIIRSDWVRAAVALSVSAGHPAGEIVINLTNIHWYLTLAALLIAVTPAQRKMTEWSGAVFVIAAGLSAPLMIAFAPIVLLKLWTNDARLSRARLGSFLAGVALHQLAIWLTIANRAPIHVEPVAILESTGYFFKLVWDYVFFGYEGGYFLEQFPFSFQLLLLSALVAASVVAWWKVRKPADGAVIGSLFISFVALVTLSSSVRGIEITTLLNTAAVAVPNLEYSRFSQSRYLYHPYCLLLVFLAVIVDRVISKRRIADSGWKLSEPWPTAVMYSAGWIFIVNVVSTQPMLPLEDLGWRSYAEKLEAGWRGPIPIHPNGWTIDVGRSAEDSNRDPSLWTLLLPSQNTSRHLVMVDLDGRRVPAMFQHAPNSVTVSLVPTRDFLEFDFGLDPRVWEKSDGVTFIVSACTEKRCRTLFEKLVSPITDPASRGFQHAVVPLGRYRNRDVELTLQVNPEDGSDNDWALWVNPRWADAPAGE